MPSATLRFHRRLMPACCKPLIPTNSYQKRRMAICDFEIPSTPDASLLQTVDPNEQLPEERDGLVATLRMDVDICEADQRDSGDHENARLLADYSFGYLPAYKGYGYLGDEDLEEIPAFISERETHTNPVEYSLVTLHP